MVNVETTFREAVKISHELGKKGSYSFVVETFSLLSGLQEADARNSLYDYLFQRFSSSKELTIESFIDSMLLLDDTPQIKSSLTVVPEKPVDEELREEVEQEETTESILPTEVTDFFKQIGLQGLDEEQAELFLYRFQDVVASYIDDEDLLKIMVYLFYTGNFEPEKLSEGEVEELRQIVSAFTSEPKDLKEAKEEKSNVKIGAVTTLVAATLLFGIGGLLVAGLFLALSGQSDKDYASSKEDLTNDDAVEKVKSGQSPVDDSKKEEIQDKPQVPASEIKDKPKNLIQAISNDLSSLKDNIKSKVTSAVEKGNQAIVSGYEKTKDVISHPVETAKKVGTAVKDTVTSATDFSDTTGGAVDDVAKDEKSVTPDEQPVQPKSKKKSSKKDKDLDPDAYHKKYGECPDGWVWDSDKNACVKNSKKPKKESNELLSILIL